jgi:exosome complex component RRP43
MESSAVERRAASFEAVHPEDYYQRFIAQGIRPDGRALGGCRALSVSAGHVSTAVGSALARCGRTSAVAAVTLQVGTPLEATPECGDIDVQVHLGPLCDAGRFAVGRPPAEAVALGALLKRVLCGSGGAFDTEQLGITRGRSAWQLHLDVMVLGHDGAVADVAMAAACAALLDTTLPELAAGGGGGADGDAAGPGGADAAAMNDAPVAGAALGQRAQDDLFSSMAGGGAEGEEGVRPVRVVAGGAQTRLALRALPVALTVAVVRQAAEGESAAAADAGATAASGGGGGALRLVADPSAQEESLAVGLMTVVRDGAGGAADGALLSVSLPGSAALAPEALKVGMEMCGTRAAAVGALLEQRKREINE